MPDYRAGSWVHPDGGWRAGSPVYVDLEQGQAPSGYSVSFDHVSIRPVNQQAASFTIAGAEVGAVYTYSITSSGGAGEVANTGVVGDQNHQVTGLNLSGLPDGTLTLHVTLTNDIGTGPIASNTIEKDTVPPAGYQVAVDQPVIDANNASSMSISLAGAEVGSSYAFSIASTGGGAPVAGSGVVQSPNQQVTGIDVSSLPDGLLTVSLLLTDPAGNPGEPTTSTVQKLAGGTPQLEAAGYILVHEVQFVSAIEVTQFETAP